MSKAKKYYAVAKPTVVQGVYDTWAEVQEFFKEYKVIHKSFKNYDEALMFSKSFDIIGTASKKNLNIKPMEPYEIKENIYIKDNIVKGFSNYDTKKILEIHTDGSYNKDTNMAGSGIVFVQDGRIIFEDSDAIVSRGDWQITGETFAAKKAISIADEFGFKKVLLCHDLNALGYWYNGYYELKNEGAKEFIEEVEKFENNDGIIQFKWEKGHSDNQLNNRADYLAQLRI